MKEIIKKILAEIAVIIVFAVISCTYFYGPISQNRVLIDQDNSAAVDAQQEMSSYNRNSGERTRWTNSIFCGMPTYQMAPSYYSSDKLNFLERLSKLYLPTYAGYLFVLLLGFYLMMRAFDFRLLYAVLGSILWAFSSYFVIIIAVGHIWKLMALAYIPPTIGGVWLCYRKKYLWGIVMTALFLALQIKSNHPQMTYYFIPVIIAVSIVFLVKSIKEKTYREWFTGSLACLAAAIIGISINASHLYHTYQYTQESIRGKSELVKDASQTAITGSAFRNDNENSSGSKDGLVENASDGLSINYATNWSIGIGETWSLLVPNVKGATPQNLMDSDQAKKMADRKFKNIYKQIPQYWGEQPTYDGAIYVGAIVMFLFVLGLMVVKGSLKWCLFIITVFSVMLSWGSNMMWLTELFFKYVPMYSKFRTVSSILIVAEFTIPLIAILALRYLLETPDVTTKTVKLFNKYDISFSRCLLISFCLTGGMCFLFWLMPSLFFRNYISTNDMNMLNQLSEGYGGLFEDIEHIRRAIFSADAMRSLLFILLALPIIWLGSKKKIDSKIVVISLTVLCLLDLWTVDKRYLNDNTFSKKHDVAKIGAAKNEISSAELYILNNQQSYSRVLDMTVNTFNDNSSSRFFFSMGGYHAAKLRRYQELVNTYFFKEFAKTQDLLAPYEYGAAQLLRNDTLIPVLNMLNMEYILMGDNKENSVPIKNQGANGNVWFVDNVSFVDNANQELNSLETLNTKHSAVADKKFESILGISKEQPESTTAELTQYKANELKYSVFSEVGGVAVFSDIFYPGWTATIDNKEVSIGRVNYLLRAINVPEGKHEVVFRFDPKTLKNTEQIANINVYILFSLIVITLLFEGYKKLTRKDNKD